MEKLPVDPALLESANRWFDISWYGLLIAGGFTALAAVGTVFFLFMQFWSSGVRERHTEWRTTELETQTAEARKETTLAQERIAALNNETARLSSDAEASRAAIAGANARALEAQLALERFRAPRQISPDQQETLRAKLAPFAGTVARIWTLPAGADITPFSELIAHVLDSAKWVVGGATSLSGRTFPGVVVAFRKGSDAEQPARVIVDYLNSIDAALAQPFDNEDGLMPAANMHSPAGADEPKIVIVIGTKQ